MNLVRVLAPRFRRLEQEMDSRDAFWRMSKTDRDLVRLERLNGTWAGAIRSSPYYHELATRLRLPAQFRSLEEYAGIVPVTRREDLRAAPEAFRTSQPIRGEWMCTSGSTGSPTRVFWGLPGHLENVRDQYWARRWWGFQPFDRMAMLWGHSYSFTRGMCHMRRNLSVWLSDRLRNRRRFSAYRLDVPTLRRYYDAMARFRPKAFYAYASAMYLLALANVDRGPFPQCPVAAFLTAEPVLPAYRELIPRVFGCPAVGEYGSSECGALAFEGRAGGYQVFERSVILETVKTDVGYTILVTQLRDSGFPLFRYEVGDMTSQPLSINREKFETLADVIGRSHDVLQTPSGALCHGEAIRGIIDQGLPDVALYSVIQRRDFSIEVLMQARTGGVVSDKQLSWFVERLHRVFGDDLEIRARLVAKLERTPAQKHRFMISELEPPSLPAP